MKLFQCIIPILLYLIQCFAFDLPKGDCHSELNINNIRYNMSKTYYVGEAYPTDAHYDVFGNLFYVERVQIDEGYHFNVHVIKFKTTASERIPGLPEDSSYSIAIDKNEKKVYFGTGNGIYRYNYETHEATPVSNKIIKLDMMFVDKDSNKYITENKDGVEELFLLDGENKIPFNTLESLDEMAIDDNNNFYYIKADNLYVLKSTHSTPICIGNVAYDGMAQIAVHNNSVFVASDSFTYFHENDTGRLKLVENAPNNVTAIAFDKMGDFVLGVRGKFLKYKKKECHFSKNVPTNVIGIGTNNN